MDPNKKYKRAYPLLAFALATLVNPNVHVFDFLPDFIGCLIIAALLAYPAPRVAYFEEARNGFLKLALISALKLPAFLILVYVRSGNYSDNDIFALFSFAFAAVEIIFAIGAINALFRALFHLGERSELSELIKPFPVGKTKMLKPEKLQLLTVIFVIFKCAAYTLPEMLLLTKTVDAGSAATVFNAARLYPYVIVVMFVSVAAFGAVVASRLARYAKGIIASEGFYPAVDGMTRDGTEAELSKRLSLREMRFALLITALACLTTPELRFDNFSEINLLPHFVFSLILAYGTYRLGKFVSEAKKATVASLVAAGFGAVAYAVECVFLTSVGFEKLAKSNDYISAYLPTLILNGIETAATVAAIFFTANAVFKFALLHTGVEPESERYMRSDLESHRKIQRNVYIWALFGVVSSLSKFLNSLFKAFSRSVEVPIQSDGIIITETVAEPLFPWFGTAVLALAILFAGWSLYLFGSLREDCELKYI